MLDDTTKLILTRSAAVIEAAAELVACDTIDTRTTKGRVWIAVPEDRFNKLRDAVMVLRDKEPK